jgi:hypothetical protein
VKDYRIKNPRCFVLRMVHTRQDGSRVACLMWLAAAEPHNHPDLPGFLPLTAGTRGDTDPGARPPAEYPTAAAARAARAADSTSPTDVYRVFRRGVPERKPAAKRRASTRAVPFATRDRRAK